MWGRDGGDGGWKLTCVVGIDCCDDDDELARVDVGVV